MKGKINNRILYIVLPICFTFVTALILVLTCLCSHLLPNIYKMPKIENAHLDMSGREDWVVLPGEWEYFYDKWIVTDNIVDAVPDGTLKMPDVWTGKTTNDGRVLPRDGYGSFRLIVENVKPGLEILVFANNYDGAYRTYINGVLNVEYGIMSKEKDGAKSNGRAEQYYPYRVGEGERLVVVVETSNNNEGGMHYAFYLRSDFKANQVYVGDQISLVVLGILFALFFISIILAIIYKKQDRQWSLSLLLLFFVLMYIFSIDILALFSLSLNTLSYNCIAEVFYTISVVTIILFMVHLYNNGMLAKPKKVVVAVFSVLNVLCMIAFYMLSGYKERIIPVLIQIMLMSLLYFPIFKAASKKVKFANAHAVILFGLIFMIGSQLMDMLEFVIIGTESVGAGSMVVIMLAIFTMNTIRIADKNKQAIQSESYKRRLAEMKNTVLKEQIKPHFVFNCLSAVQATYHDSLALGDEAITEFATHLRSIVDADTKPYVGLDEEITNVVNYVKLVELSKSKPINLLLDIDNYDIMVPIFSIQPFVENSIKHSGIVDSEDGYVCITLTDVDAKKFEITIEDNGCGFDESSISATSVGLSNAVERIKIMLGTDVKICSQPQKGTRITIIIPKENRR